jgi:hypothetical protein
VVQQPGQFLKRTGRKTMTAMMRYLTEPEQRELLKAAKGQACPRQTLPSSMYECNQQLLANYTDAQIDAVTKLYRVAKQYLFTSGGNTAAQLLLGLYNGERFPFDLTDLRLLDEGNLTAAMVVLHMDAAHTYCEIHVLLDAILGLPLGQSTGNLFEHWAYDMRLKGACKKAQLPSLGRAA